MKKVVMFVDDEKFILRSLRRLVKGEIYDAVFMESGADALDYLKENKIDLIISDIRMPNMDGFQLLSAIKEQYPQVLRVALSGFTESKTIYKLIEKNIVKLYLFKPWDNYELKQNIIRILDFEDVLMSHQLLVLINNLDKLPTLPKLYQELRQLMDDDAGIDKVAELVEMDQAISTKVLRLANSAFYGRKTGSISKAIMSIGLNNLKNLVLASSFFGGSDGGVEDIEQLWENAVNTNKLTLLIYEKLLKKKIPSIYASAGLLHDIGKVVSHMFYGKAYNEVLNEAQSSDEAFVTVEYDHFNLTHQDIGAYLLNWWELPFAYVEAAMFHHRPYDKRVINYELVAVVHIANYYSLKTLSPDGTTNLLDPRVFSGLEIDQEAVEALVQELI